MTTRAITDKLGKQLNQGIKTEPHAVYLLTGTRKLIERDQLRDQYPENIYWLRGKIGDPVWLWMALNVAIKQPLNMENEWLPVLESKPIGDSQIGQTLFADGETVIAWRSRLESLGLIRTTPVPDKGIWA